MQSWKIPEVEGDELLTPWASSRELHVEAQAALTLHICTHAPQLLFDTLFLLLICWASLIFLRFFTCTPSASFRIFVLLSTICFRPFKFPLKSPAHWIIGIKSSTFSIVSGHHPCIPSLMLWVSMKCDSLYNFAQMCQARPFHPTSALLLITHFILGQDYSFYLF